MTAEKCDWFKPAFDSRWKYILACVRQRRVKILWRMGWWWLTDRKRYRIAWNWALFLGVYNAPKKPASLLESIPSVQPQREPLKNATFKLEYEHKEDLND